MLARCLLITFSSKLFNPQELLTDQSQTDLFPAIANRQEIH